MKVADATVDEVAEFLAETFVPPGGHAAGGVATFETRMTEYARLGKFLSDPVAVNLTADQLSVVLQAGFQDPGSHGSFSETLRAVGPAFGFSPDVVVLNGQVDGADFAPVVTGNRLFRDVFTRPHGEYTHAVQWLLMAHRFGGQIDVPKLYQESVRYTSEEPVPVRGTNEPIQIWNWLVDCFPGTGEDFRAGIVCNTYRSPQFATHNLRGLGTQSWLGNFLLTRRRKGLAGGEPNPPGGHYDRQRVITMSPGYVERLIADQRAAVPFGTDRVLRKLRY